MSSELPQQSLTVNTNSTEPSSSLPLAHLAGLADRARTYAEASSSANTRRAYASDWRHFASWCRRKGIDAFAPEPQVVGLYITACASGEVARKPDKVSTIERRLSALTWNYAQRGRRSTARTGISPPCSLASATATPRRSGRRKWYCPTT